MSRHRAVRNLNLEDELAEDEYDEYEALGTPKLTDDLSPEDADALEAALIQVVDTIGTPEQCGISDRTMREALWDAYFDPAEATDRLLQDKAREEAHARKQAGESGTQAAGGGNGTHERATQNGPRGAHEPRKPQDVPNKPEAPTPQPPPAQAPAKPLSKLQQKVLMNKARQAAQGGDKPKVAPPQPKQPAVPAPPAPPVVDSNVSALFPPPESKVPLSSGPSVFTQAPVAPVQLHLVSLDDWRFAGQADARPTVPDAEMEQLRRAFSELSPDDRVLEARKGTKKERNRQENAKKQPKAPPKATEKRAKPVDPLTASISRLEIKPTPAKHLIPVDEILSQARAKAETELPISLVVVGHVDAGKSTLMGRMLLEFGHISERVHQNHERASQRIGKGSFSYAWALDSSEAERERGITIDVAQDTFRTQKHTFHLLDAPGHRDFVPNMISGASQADAAVLVVDASPGEFESGFSPRGQTREHVMLLRALGVQQLIVAVNKMDMVDYSQARFDEIVNTLKAFLANTGFAEKNVNYLPCAAGAGENLLSRKVEALYWYRGDTLCEALDDLAPPERQYTGALRIPVTNVFKGTTMSVSSGLGVSGRIVSGVVQAGESVLPMPGDTPGVIKAIECEGDVVPWAVAGASVTLYLAGLETNQVSVGDVLCSPSAPITLCTSVQVQLLVFQPTYPLVTGTAVEAFSHSADIPAQLSELVALLDKSSGEEIRKRPRVLPHNSTAVARVTLGTGARKGYPIEPYRANKEMSRLLFRMNGETVAAGIATDVFP